MVTVETGAATRSNLPLEVSTFVIVAQDWQERLQTLLDQCGPLLHAQGALVLSHTPS